MAIGRFAVSCFLSFVVQASNDFFYLELTYDTTGGPLFLGGRRGARLLWNLEGASGKRAFTIVKLGRAKIPLL